MKTVVIFQGGGPLGAFGCGAWQVVAAWLHEQGHELTAVAGASIGALNAATVACHAEDADLGAAAVERLWRRDIAVPMPGVPGAPRMGDEARAWAGWWQGFALGNRALFSPLYAHWHPLAGLRRASLPMYSQEPMRRLFGSIVGSGYFGRGLSAPLLAVAATDVLTGELRIFHSDEAPIDATVLCASAAIPLMFQPVPVGDRVYVDGEVNRRTATAGVIEALHAGGRVGRRERLQLVTIGQFSRHADRLPRTSPELLDRSLHLLVADKLADEPLPAGQRIDITRGPEPYESISGQFDYSLPRIEALLEAGRAAASAALGRAPEPQQPLPAPAKARARPGVSGPAGRRGSGVNAAPAATPRRA
ncbi:MAG: hypothetical protein EOP35_05320 [Rubrivivax sp.]|nr:MAG: hypothetical protein EOP35_05320 [Rubrivivax sp.]